MWFEPLKDIVNQHADSLTGKLNQVITHLAAIASNTESELGQRWAFKSIPVPGESSEQLRNDSGYDWIIKDVAATETLTVFLNAEPSGFLAEIGTKERDNVHWYVPVGSVLIIKNEGGPAKVDPSLNLNIEYLVHTSKEGHTGTSEEKATVPRDPPIPSGHPLGV